MQPYHVYNSWASLQRDFNEHIQSDDAEVAGKAANALDSLLYCHPAEAATMARPVAIAEAVTAALWRHRRDSNVQFEACLALHKLCHHRPELRAALRRDPSVEATVAAAAVVEPDLEGRDWYQELRHWLKPPGYTAAQRGASSPSTNPFGLKSFAKMMPAWCICCGERLPAKAGAGRSGLMDVPESESRSTHLPRAAVSAPSASSCGQDPDVRETEWYYSYRQVVFKKLEDAEDDGAPGMVLISIKPKLVNNMTLQEWPELQKDLHQAYKDKNAPFFKGKQKEVVKFAKITTQQFSVEELGEELLTRTRNGKQAIICSVPEEHFEEVEAIIK